MTLLGRGPLLSRTAALVENSAARSRAQVIAISGQPGYGKSAIVTALRTILAAPATRLIFYVDCLRNNTLRPGAAIESLLQCEADSLQATHQEYVTGLELLFDSSYTLAPERLELGFLRLLSALADDFSIVLIIDDWQWIDKVSASILQKVFAHLLDRPITIVLAKRPDVPCFDCAPMTPHTIDLEALDLSSTIELIKRYYPSANDDVLDAIARCSSGVPLDTITLARQANSVGASCAEEIASGLGEAVREDLSRMSADIREVLEFCSLIREPVPYRVLVTAFEENQVRRAFDAIIPRYLIQEPTGFTFVHVLLREVISNNIHFRAALQHIALKALRLTSAPSLEQLRDIADLCNALGDNQGVIDAALKLAERAAHNQEWAIACDAYRKAFETSTVTESELVPRYLEYIGILRLLEQNEEARAFLEASIVSLSASGSSRGVGLLAGALANVLWSLGDLPSAMSLCERYLASIDDDTERAELQSVALSLRTLAGQPGLTTSKEYDELIRRGTSRVAARLLSTRAFVHARCGEHEAMIRDLAEVTAQRAMSSSLSSQYIRDMRLMCQWNETGVESVRESLIAGVSGGYGSLSHQLSFLTLVDFAAGEWALALDRVSEISLDRFSRIDQDRILIPCAAILALGEQSDPLLELVERRAWNLLDNGSGADSVEIALWYAVSPTSARLPRSDIKHIAQWISSPKIIESLFPIEVGFGVFAAKFPEAKDAVRRISATPRSPWFRANYDMALGWIDGDPEKLSAAATRMRALGAKALADLALKRAGLAVPGRPPETLTPRERQVCTLVADGLTNRAIAQRLFLSERTVETHVSNALSKFGARTRTELARRLAKA